MSYPVMQYLRKGAIVIIGWFHVTANTWIFACTTDNADVWGSLVEFATGDLNASASFNFIAECQCPLALKAKTSSGAYAGATVITDLFHVFIQ